MWYIWKRIIILIFKIGASAENKEDLMVCNIGSLTKDIDVRWIDPDVTGHVTKINSDLVKFAKLKKREQIICVVNNTGLDVEGLGTFEWVLRNKILIQKIVLFVPEYEVILF